MSFRRTSCTLLAALLAATCAVPALAEKPDWAGGGGKGGGKHEHKHRDRDDDRRGDDRRGGGYRQPVQGQWFGTHDRQVVWGYYAPQVQSPANCPPGLAKKGNGCQPPGQAKKYRMGQPLPAGVAIYPVPNQVLVQLPPAPVGHKYVRVAADILLIAVGTSMVVDAISDLGRL